MDRALQEALARFDLGELEVSADLVYAVSPELRLTFVNTRYRQVAEESGHGAVLERYPLGAQVLDAMEGAVRDHYRALFERALGDTDPIATDYVCPTPTAYVEQRCTIYPLGEQGLLLVHGAIERREWTDEELDRLRDVDTRLLSLCAGCRRVRTPSGEWLYVPRLLDEVPEGSTHGLCDPCLGYYLGH
jgi:hypothetical protein